MAIDPQEGKIIAKTVREQTAMVIENIKAILQAAGYELNDVIRSTVYLASMDLFSEFNTEYAKYFGKDFPARATAGVKLMSNALVEISVVAYRE